MICVLPAEKYPENGGERSLYRGIDSQNEYTAIAPGDDLVNSGRSLASTRVRCDHLHALLATGDIYGEIRMKNENLIGLIVSDNCAFT